VRTKPSRLGIAAFRGVPAVIIPVSPIDDVAVLDRLLRLPDADRPVRYLFTSG
jgi:hypothetical protein